MVMSRVTRLSVLLLVVLLDHRTLASQILALLRARHRPRIKPERVRPKSKIIIYNLHNKNLFPMTFLLLYYTV